MRQEICEGNAAGEEEGSEVALGAVEGLLVTEILKPKSESIFDEREITALEYGEVLVPESSLSGPPETWMLQKVECNGRGEIPISLGRG